MASKEIAYQPLERSSDDIRDEVLLQHYATSTGKQRWERIVWTLCILAIVISNGVWLGVYKHQKNVPAAKEYHVLSPYEYATPYVDGNLTEMNQLWTDLFPRGGGAVKVDPQWAIDSNLQQTQGYAADGKAIYVVAMYHQLHCVTVIRTSLYQQYNGRKQIDNWGHITHCIDTLRQGIQCLADPTLGGVGANHECRDFEALKRWTKENAYTDNLDLLNIE